HLIAVERLRDVVEGVMAQSLDGRVERAVPGDDERFDLRIDLLDALEDGDAAETRHAQVEGHQIDGLSADRLERFVTRRGGEDVAVLAENGTQGLADAELVVDDEDTRALGHGEAWTARSMPSALQRHDAGSRR